MNILRTFTILLFVLLFQVSFIACFDDPGSDHSKSSNGDPFGDVDDGGDGGDDDDDASPKDDDDDNDTFPASTYLFVIGSDSNRTTSWMQTDTGWIKFPIPRAVTVFNSHFGPSSVFNGEVGHAVWNQTSSIDMVPYNWNRTAGHSWLRFDPALGWSRDYSRPQAGVNYNIKSLFAFDNDLLWASSQYEFDAIGRGFPEGYRLRFKAMVSVIEGSTLTTHRVYPFGIVPALYALTNSSVVVSATAYNRVFPQLVEYNGSNWIHHPMPVGFQFGFFTSLVATNPSVIYAIWEDPVNYYAPPILFHMTAGSWQQIPPPSGCGNIEPTWIVGDANLVIVGDSSDPTSQFWEFRQGQWTCRNLGGYPNPVQLKTAIILKDGRVFIGGKSNGAAVVFEVDDLSVTPIMMPINAIDLKALHAFGPEAPTSSSSQSN